MQDVPSCWTKSTSRTRPATASRRKATEPEAFGKPSPIELKAREGSPLKSQPTGWLQPHKFLPTDRHSDESITDLSESIREFGLREPIVISEGRYDREILFGYRRFLAWKRLESTGEIEGEIPVYRMCQSHRAAAYMVARESSYRNDSLVQRARLLGQVQEERDREVGDVVEARDLTHLVDMDEETISKYLEVYRALQDPYISGHILGIENPELDLLCMCIRIHYASRKKPIRQLEILAAREARSCSHVLSFYAADGASVAKQIIEKMFAGDLAWRSRSGDRYEITYDSSMSEDELDTLLTELDETKKEVKRAMALRSLS